MNSILTTSSNLKISFLIFFQITMLGILSAQPQPCEDPPEMTPFCNAQTCIVCDIDGFQGRHESNVQGELPADFCTTQVHNAQWIAFVAGSETLKIEITVTNCDINWGLEIGMYESLDCETFMKISNCDTDVDEGETATLTTNTPLTIGQYYFIVMDGSNGDNCDWVFSVVEGTTEVSPLTTSGIISGDSIVCTGQINQYETTVEEGATIFDWTLNGLSVDSEGPVVNIEWTEDGEYELCVTASNACDDAPPSCTTMTAISFPSQTLNEIICTNESFILHDTIELTEAGSYEFNLPSVDGCDSIVFVNLEVFEASETSIDVNICEGDSLLIGDTPFFETGQFVEVLDNYIGCDSVVSLDLFVVICEIQGASNEIPVVCFDEASGMIEFSVQDGTPPFTYTWQDLENNISGSGNISNLNEIATIQNVPVGTYLITINDTFGNDVILIQNVSQPPLLVNDWEISDYNGFSVTCFKSEDGTLEVIPAGGAGGYVYSWNTGNETALINNIPAGDYEVTITDSYGCTLVVQNSLNEPDGMDFEIYYDNGTCGGLETGFIEVLSVTGGATPYLYDFNNKGFSDETILENLPTGTYTVAIQDANGCELDTVSSISTPIIPVVNLGEDLDILLGEDIQINPAANIVLDSVLWSQEPGLDCYDCPEPTARPFFTTQYTMTAISEDDCLGSDSIIINVIERRRVVLPNIFSPNNDGINDLFVVFAGLEASLVKDFKVFSRWGSLVYEGQDFLPNSVSDGWNGTSNGEVAEVGIYAWFAEVEFLDGVVETFEGDVMLVR